MLFAIHFQFKQMECSKILPKGILTTRGQLFPARHMEEHNSRLFSAKLDIYIIE